MNKCAFLGVFLSFLPCSLWAQTGGESTFAFMKIPVSPVATALGGTGISYAPELGIALQNPSQLVPELNRQLEISFRKYITDIRFTQLGYAHRWNERLMLAWDMAYMNYGRFEGADENSEWTGDFTVSEYRIGSHASIALSKFWTLGASLHFLYGQYERYKAAALAGSLALAFHSDDWGLRSSFALKHIGGMLYSDANTGDKLPFEMEWSLVKKLQKAPFAFSVSLHELQSWQLYHSTSTEEDLLLGEQVQESRWTKAGKELLNHVSLGVELSPSENFGLMAGYNFRRNQALGVNAQTEMTGFSFGLGLKIRRVSLRYAWAPMHLAGSVHHVGLSFRLLK